MTVIDFHSEIAANLDEKYYISKNLIQRYDLITKTLRKYIALNFKVLDAGCGTGIFSFYCSNHFSSDVYAFDGSDKMINLCKQKAKILKNKTTFLEKKLPFESSIFDNTQFDLILSSSVLEFIDDFDMVFSQLTNQLKQEGILIVTLPNKNSLFRYIENLTFSIFQYPKYFKFVKHLFFVDQFNLKMKSFGFECLEIEYFSDNDPISKILKLFLPKKYTNTLFLGVYKKI